MSKSLISVRKNEIYASDVSIKAEKDGTDNTLLIIEFTVQSEPEHSPYSPYEQTNKREFDLIGAGTGITSTYYNVTSAAGANDTLTKFMVTAKISSKVPGTGSGLVSPTLEEK